MKEENKNIKIYRIAAFVSYAVAFYYFRCVICMDTVQNAGEHWINAPIFALIMVAGVEAFASALGLTHRELKQRGQSPEEAIFLAACVLLQAFALGILGVHDDSFGGAQFVMWHFAFVYYVAARTGMLAQGRTGILFFLDAIQAGFFLPWTNIFLRIASIFQMNKKEEAHPYISALQKTGEETTGGALSAQGSGQDSDDILDPARARRAKNAAILIVSILTALLVVAIAWSQLADVTDSFDGFGKGVREFLGRIFSADMLSWFCSEVRFYLIVSIPIGAWLFGLIGGSLKRKTPPCSADRFEEETRPLHVFPAWSSYIIIGALLAIYLLFILVSAREISEMFLITSITPQRACTLAVKGFWELVRIVVLNFAVLLGFTLFSDLPLWERRTTRILITFLFAFALVFGFLAFWKLFVLYIGQYGFTPRRILSGWILCILILWTILTLIRFYKEIPAVRIGILTAAATFTLITFLPV